MKVGGVLITLSEGLLGVGASLVAQSVKNLFAVQETRVRSLGRENPLEKDGDLQPTPLFLPGKSHGQRNLVGCSPWYCKKLGRTEQLTLHFTTMGDMCVCAKTL